MTGLDSDEKALAVSVERGDWHSVRDLQRRRKRYQKYAEATLRKGRRINIRISGKDLTAIQKRAVEEGIPYQTLIAGLLHKYASGRLVERSLTKRSGRRQTARTGG